MFLGLWKMLRTPESCDVFDESDSDEFRKMEDPDDLMTENDFKQDCLNALNGNSEVPIVQANWNTHPLLNVAEHISDTEEDNLQVAVAEEVTEAKALDIEEVTDAIITWDESNNIKQEEDIFFDLGDDNMDTAKDATEEDQTRDNENLLINLDMDQPLKKDTVEAVSLIDFGDELKQIKKETRRLIWNQKVRTKTVDSWLGFSSAPVENPLQQQNNVGNNKAQIKTEPYTEQLLDISTPPEKEERLTTPDLKHILDEDETSDYESASSSHFQPNNPDSPTPTIAIGSNLTTDRDEEGKESDDDSYRAKYKTYSESVVERDIRLAKDREEELRKDRLLAMANAPLHTLKVSPDQKAKVVSKKLDSSNVSQDATMITPIVNKNSNESIQLINKNTNELIPMINKIANEVIPNESDTVVNKIANESIPSSDKIINESTAMLDKNGNESVHAFLVPLVNSDAIKSLSAVHNVPVSLYVTQKNTQRFLASSRIQQEIEEEMRREMTLRDEGVILTTSVETLDDKAAEIGEAVRGSEAIGSSSGRHFEQEPEVPSAFPFIYEPSTPPTSPTQSVTSLSVPTIPTPVPSPPASVSSDDVPSTPSWTSSASSRRDNFVNPSNKLGSMDASGSNRKGIMSKFIASGGRLILSPAFNTPTPRTKQEAAPVTEDAPTATEPSSVVLEKPVSSEPNTNKVNFKAPRWRNSTVSSAVQLRIDEELRVMKLRETELRSRRFRSKGFVSLDGDNQLVLPNSNEVDLIENEEDTVTVPNSGKPRLLIAQWEEMIQQSSEC